jgi:hypothetical protein
VISDTADREWAMRFQHGALAFDAPDGWLDESRIVLAEPPDHSFARDLAKRAATAGAPVNLAPALPRPRSNFVLSTRRFTADPAKAHELCENELKRLLLSFAQAKLGELSWVQVGGREAAIQDVEFQYEDSTLKQLHALAVWNGLVVHFVATTTRAEFARTKELFLATLASLRVGDPA